MHRILLLGSSGYIGKQAKKKFSESNKYELGIMDRFLNKVMIGDLQVELEDWHPFVIVNLASNSTENNYEDIWNANYFYPSSIISRLWNPPNPIIWVQFSSYYQLYYKCFKVDKNLYAKSKRFFSNYLYNLEKQNKLVCSDITLPHIFGNDEPDYRVIPQMIRSKFFKEPLRLTSGKQILPLLDIKDLVMELEILVDIAIKGMKQTGFLQQSCNASLNIIAKTVFGNEFNSLAIFDSLESRKNEFYTDVWKHEKQICNFRRRNITSTFEEMYSKLKNI